MVSYCQGREILGTIVCSISLESSEDKLDAVDIFSHFKAALTELERERRLPEAGKEKKIWFFLFVCLLSWFIKGFSLMRISNHSFYSSILGCATQILFGSASY